MLLVLQLYLFACWKEVLMLVGRSIVLLILYGDIVYHSCKWILGVI